jgi:alpha-L-fucosidase 2
MLLHHGLTFTWPNVPVGSPDNVIAEGQSIALSANGDTLGFLLTGVTYSPPETGKGTVIYSDGTQQSFSLSIPNWGCSSDDQMLTLPYRNKSNGTRDNYQVCVYYASVSLQRSKTVAQVILPNLGAGLLPSLRIFAIAVGNYS